MNTAPNGTAAAPMAMPMPAGASMYPPAEPVAMMSADHNVAQHFVPMFYELIDTKRNQVHRLYHENAQLVRDNKTAEGVAAVEQFYAALPQTRHHVKFFQGLPGPYGVSSTIVNVSGDYEVNGAVMPFMQSFLLLQLPNASYGISNDTFRTADPSTMGLQAPIMMPVAPQQYFMPGMVAPVAPPQAAGAMAVVPPSDSDRRSIFVGHVEYAATEDDLRNLFSRFGQVLRVTIKRDFQTKASKGFAYVEFSEESMAQNALSLNGTEFMGMALKVMQKRTNIPGYSKTFDNSSQMDTSYRGGRGGGRGGRSGGRGGYSGGSNGY